MRGFFLRVDQTLLIENCLNILNTSICIFMELDRQFSYPNELAIKNITESSMSDLYLDILLNRDINGKLTTQLYDKRDDFTSHIYVAIYHHHLHMVCMSHNSFDTLEHILHMFNF